MGHFTYEGSLSTPPCTEGVMNYVLKTPIELSKGQINKFPFKVNARPVQNMNGRKIAATE
jgi:carbonic anhydrase